MVDRERLNYVDSKRKLWGDFLTNAHEHFKAVSGNPYIVYKAAEIYAKYDIEYWKLTIDMLYEGD